MLHEALVALAGEEVIGDGGVGAEGFGGCEVVDLAGYALGAELAGGGLFEAWWEGGLDKLVGVAEWERGELPFWRCWRCDVIVGGGGIEVWLETFWRDAPVSIRWGYPAFCITQC